MVFIIIWQKGLICIEKTTPPPLPSIFTSTAEISSNTSNPPVNNAGVADEEKYYYIEDWTGPIPLSGDENPVGPSNDMSEYTHPIDDGYLRPVHSYETCIEGRNDEDAGEVEEGFGETNNGEARTSVDIYQNSLDDCVDSHSPVYIW